MLLTELLKIVLLENHQHKTILSSSKAAIKIFALYSSSTNSSTKIQDSEPLVTLIFKDTHEQDFWYKIISELWSGVSIAQQQCDTTVLHTISKHIALIDTLINIDYNEQTSATSTFARSKPSRNQVIRH